MECVRASSDEHDAAYALLLLRYGSHIPVKDKEANAAFYLCHCRSAVGFLEHVRSRRPDYTPSAKDEVGYVYVLVSGDERYVYTGVTTSPYWRWHEHNWNFGSKSSLHKGPWKMVKLMRFSNMNAARELESYMHEHKNNVLEYAPEVPRDATFLEDRNTKVIRIA